MDAAQQAAINQAVQAALAAQAAAPPPQAPPPAPIFALAPALVDPNTFINYKSREGTKLFDQAVAKLASTFNFDDPADLQALLDQVSERSETCGWGNIWNIDCQENDPVVVGAEIERNLLTDYGHISWRHVERAASAYAANQDRQAQNGFNSYKCIYDSLDANVLKKMAPYKEKSMIAGNKNGPMLLKTIISVIFVDTRATVTLIRTQLSKLDEKMVELGYDVEAFNLYVNKLLTDLAARGQETHDLFTNLLKGYEVVPDEKFKDLIERKRDAYEEGEDISEKMFMATAKAKYMARSQAKLWNAPTQEQEQILALTAQIEKLQSSSSKKKSSEKKKDTGKRKTPKDFAWKKVSPKNDDPQSKTVNSILYFWCIHHEMWTVHKPEACRLNKDKDPEGPKDEARSGNKKEKWSNNKKYKAAKVAAALLDSDDDEEYFDEDDEQE